MKILNIRIKIKSLLLNNKQLKDQKINKFISSTELSNKINLINNGKHSIKIKEVTREVFQIEKIWVKKFFCNFNVKILIIYF